MTSSGVMSSAIVVKPTRSAKSTPAAEGLVALGQGVHHLRREVAPEVAAGTLGVEPLRHQRARAPDEQREPRSGRVSGCEAIHTKPSPSSRKGRNENAACIRNRKK